MDSPRQLLISAYPVGYGPAAKALVLAAQCRLVGLPSVFVGNGVAYELVSRSDGVFQDVVRARAHEPVARRLVRDSPAVVSVMDRDFAALAGELSRPLHVVDSLLWMRDRVPEAFRSAERYWAQDFIGVRDRLADVSPPHTVIGPIIDSPPTGTGSVSGKLVVSLGGFEAADDRDRDRIYGELVLRALGESRLASAFARRITVLASEGNVRSLGHLAQDCGVELTSLSHVAALREFADASLVVAAPGLTTTLECFQLGLPTFFLPPRNYSQWSVLKALRVRGLAANALHWEDLADDCRLGERLPEADRNPGVAAAIDRLAVSPAARKALSRSLSSCVDSDLGAMARRQQEFFHSLGTNGAAVIAARLASESDG